mmetsp:Transcript_89119/g.288644  ORF Transcript_89119/g.288644 Transcript_89119/m.288644 type:complete len:407 (+) Transcript_89119:85-1305(+)
MASGDEPTKQEVEDFIKSNDVDERAAADLRECPPDVQRRALARGDLSSARNPSAALLARIRDARVEVRGGSSGGGSWMGGNGSSVGLPSTKSVEDFISANGIGDSAANTLRSSSPTVKRGVLACGNLSGNQDPSTELMTRIREVRAGGGNWATGAMRAGGCGGMGLPSNDDVEEFIKDNDVDGRAAADLRDLPPGLQRAVLIRGDLRSARNPSSALIARIRDAKLGVPGVPPPGMEGQHMGDMPPMGCGDMPPGGCPFPGYGGPMHPGGMPPPGNGYGYPPGYGMYPNGGYPGWYPGGYPGYPGPGGFPGGYPGGYSGGGYGMPPGSYPPGPGGQPPGPGGDPKAGGHSGKKHRGRSCSGSSSGSYSYSASASGSRSRSRSRSRGRGRGRGSRSRSRGRHGRDKRR